jgi:hypothetical protein
MAVMDSHAQSVVDRAALRESLEQTRAAFHRLVAEIGDERWGEKSPQSAWTMGEVLEHLTWALEQLPKEVEMARQGKWMFNMPKWIADPGSYWMTRWQARKADARSVLLRYDAAMDAAVRALAAVPDSDWNLGAPFYGHGFHTVARLFEVPAEHIREHTGNPTYPQAGAAA